MPDATTHVIDVTRDTIDKEVIARSREVPIVIDFWAPWCAPCRELAPLLEKLAEEHAGKFVLAKINIEEQQELAAAFGVQSIPYVVAVKDEQLVDQFVGLLPEDRLREWIARIVPSRLEELVAKGESLEAGDARGAEGAYREALSIDAENARAQIGLARVLLSANRDDESRAILSGLEARGYLEPEAERVKSELELRAAAAESGGVEEARKALAASPDDLSLRLNLADALAAAGKSEEALEICLDVVKRDKGDAGAEAKATMLRIFGVLGPQSELASQYRRKLATALY